jgi:hypothetical protein
LFAGVEYISHRLGYFGYLNGWNLGWSVIFTLIMFPLQHLHYKRPLLAWLLAIVKLIFFIVVFKVDIMSLI